VLKAGRQVAFGTAKDMLEAVRRLQAVPSAGEAGSEAAEGEGVQPAADTPTEPTPPTAAAGGAV
jgi:hypothetical protein